MTLGRSGWVNATPMLVPMVRVAPLMSMGWLTASDDSGGQGVGLGVGGGKVLHDDELVATESGDQVVTAHALKQPGGGGSQNGVTGQVAVGVVDLLEPVEIEQVDRELINRRGGARRRTGG